MMLFRVVAVNTAPDSENRMHDDAVARKHGFSGGGLVPGVDVFEYLVRGALQLDPTWMCSGRQGELRLFKPYFDGEEVLVTAPGEGEIHAGDRAILRTSGSLASPSPAWKNVALPVQRPTASTASLAPGTRLGSLLHCKLISADGPAKARQLLELANQILMQNVILDPWIHTQSKIAWLEAVQTAQQVDVCATVMAEFERKGHRLVTLDLHYRESHTGKPVAHVEHTAIWLF